MQTSLNAGTVHTKYSYAHVTLKWLFHIFLLLFLVAVILQNPSYVVPNYECGIMNCGSGSVHGPNLTYHTGMTNNWGKTIKRLAEYSCPVVQNMNRGCQTCGRNIAQLTTKFSQCHLWPLVDIIICRSFIFTSWIPVITGTVCIPVRNNNSITFSIYWFFSQVHSLICMCTPTYIL